jgi:hypothetical protein
MSIMEPLGLLPAVCDLASLRPVAEKIIPKSSMKADPVIVI